jgi:lactoylglutathione lyase
MTIEMVAPLEVGIAVRDLARMREFYEDVLGFSFVSAFTIDAAGARQAALHAGGYTVVRLQTSYGERIKLLAAVDPAPATPVPDFILDRANASYLTFIVSDIQAVVDALVEAEVPFMTGDRAVEVRPGTYLAFCRDPEGNVLEIVQYDSIAQYRSDLRHLHND